MGAESATDARSLSRPRPSGEASQFLFVSCNERNGRPGRKQRHIANRHVMLNHLNTSCPGRSRLVEFDTIISLDTADELPMRPKPQSAGDKVEIVDLTSGLQYAGDGSTAAKKIARTRKVKDRHLKKRTDPPLPSASALLPGHAQSPPPLLKQDGKELVCRWFYLSLNESSLWPYGPAKTHWADAGWQIVFRSDVFYECIALYAWRKRADLTGSRKEYLTQKGSLLQRIHSEITQRGPQVQPMVLVAIGILAACSLFDAKIQECGAHLRALRAMNAMEKFEDAQHEWMYVIWVDLRYALITATPPVLEYFVPAAYRDEQLPGATSTDIWSHARCTSRLCPRTTTFSATESFDLFHKLWKLVLAWPELQHRQDPPFGCLYDIEYRLRILDARAIELGVTDPTEQCVQLLLAAVQLVVWILSRFWAPLTPQSRCYAILRSCRLMLDVPDETLVSVWRQQADLTSALWVLSTLTACAYEAQVAPDLIPLRTLKYVIGCCGIDQKQDFLTEMQKWPWIENWHPQKMESLWDLTVSSDEAVADPNSAPRRGLACAHNAARFYLGAVEFYHS